jgi:tetratricopeptide (TPR) repeat protein
MRAQAPFAAAAATAGLAAVIYIFTLSPLMQYAQGSPLQLGGLLLLRVAVSFALLLVVFTTFIYVPFSILIGNLFAGRGRLINVLREEFAATSACALSVLAVSLIVTLPPAAVVSWQSNQLPADAIILYLGLLILMPLPVFAGFMTFVIATIFRLHWGIALVVTVLSFISLFALPILAQVFSGICASPFLLLLLFFLLRGPISEVMSMQRSRQSFRQNLEASTLNPADASAHYNLGLIYQQRGDLEAAEKSFRRAIEIDTRETDAHYQLGQIARERGQYPESIKFFEEVVRQAPTHSQHEIWREIARTYLAAGQYADALGMLDRFLADRPSDAEGHYWRGQVLASLGRTNEAEAEMKTCIESVRTAPSYKYRAEQQWLRRAEQYLRERRAS